MQPRIDGQTKSTPGFSGWQQFLRRLTHPVWFGTLRRTRPVSDQWGYDRGTPVDRYYIDRFLEAHRQDIHGHVLEVKNSAYTDRFGRNVIRKDILDIDPSNPDATVIADLASASVIPTETIDCFILTQTLQFIPDLHAAVAQIHRILRPGGVLLCTVPGLSRVERAYAASDYWRFTPAACSLLFEATFGSEQVSVLSYGNVLTAIAFLNGLASEELSKRELSTCNEYFPVIVSTRAVKRA